MEETVLFFGEEVADWLGEDFGESNSNQFGLEACLADNTIDVLKMVKIKRKILPYPFVVKIIPHPFTQLDCPMCKPNTIRWVSRKNKLNLQIKIFEVLKWHALFFRHISFNQYADLDFNYQINDYSLAIFH